MNFAQTTNAITPYQQYTGGNIPLANQPRHSNSNLSIFYINDMHGNIDNMAGMIAASGKFD